MNEKQEYLLSYSGNMEPAQLNTGINLHSKLPQIYSAERVLEYYIKNHELVLRLISRFYPLGCEMINHYKDRWDWGYLSENKSIQWDAVLIEKYEDKWEWKGLSKNQSLQWSAELIKKYEDRWNWDDLSTNSSLPWGIALIEEYKDRWNWDCLSSNQSPLPWSIGLIEKYEDKWCWIFLSGNESIPWDKALIKKYKDRWDCELLYLNESIPWDTELIKIFKDDIKWHWNDLFNNKSIAWNPEIIEQCKGEICWDNSCLPFKMSSELAEKCKSEIEKAIFEQFDPENESYYNGPLCVELIEKHKDKLDWGDLGYNNTLPWSIKLLEKYQDRWDWEELSNSICLPWSIELIEKYKDRWAWNVLSKNESLPWSIELIERCKDKWNWTRLSSNSSLPWRIELIEKYSHKWNWYNLSGNESLPWSIELIDKYKDYWEWSRLSFNASLPWSIELKDKYKDNWIWLGAKLADINTLWNNVFQKIINDKLIEKVIIEDYPACNESVSENCDEGLINKSEIFKLIDLLFSCSRELGHRQKPIGITSLLKQPDWYKKEIFYENHPFDISIISRRDERWQEREMLNFAIKANQYNMTRHVKSMFYDSSSDCCYIELADGIDQYSHITKFVKSIANTTITQYSIFDDIDHGLHKESEIPDIEFPEEVKLEEKSCLGENSENLDSHISFKPVNNYKLKDTWTAFYESSDSTKAELRQKNHQPKNEIRQSHSSKPIQKNLFGDDDKPNKEVKINTVPATVKAETTGSPYKPGINLPAVNVNMPSAIINEFIIALDQEIAVIKRGRGGSSFKIFNGRFLREVSGLSVYVFDLENILSLPDDSPAKIEIYGAKYTAQVLLIKGLKIEIGIEGFCEQNVSEANLYTNLWHLLESLKNKLLELQNGNVPLASESLLCNTKPNFDNIISCGNCGAKSRMTEYVSSMIYSCGKCKQELSPQYSLIADPPNTNQKKAIASSFLSQLAIIWGPPGTGKTKTVAKAIEAHLNAGRRVLLVSHSNAAVDEALEDVAEQLKATSFYNEGKLVRLGIPQSSHLEKLTQKCPLVLFDKIAEMLGETLSKEKRDLEGEMLQLKSVLNQYNTLIKAIQAISSLSSELDTATSQLSIISSNLSFENNDLRQLEETQAKKKDKLIEGKSAGIIKRFFKDIDPIKIQADIDQASLSIDAKRRIAKEMADRIRILKDLIIAKEIEIAKAKTEADKLLTSMRISVKEIENKKKELMSRKDEIIQRLKVINQRLDEIQRNIFSEARLIATTLTKTFCSTQFTDTTFDTLILDEASMAPLPLIYWAVSRCRGYITIVGDFLQLPPICISKEEMAQKWLGRSIFSVIGVDQVKRAERDPRVTLLDTQYRMAPKISQISNKLFYDNMLKDDRSTEKLNLDDGVSKDPLVLIETKETNPWCSRLSKGGRFNLYNALLCCALAKKIITKPSNEKIGILTPYKDQARLISKIAKDWGIQDRISIGTVHRFQGGEESIIIFDTVEGAGTRVSRMLDDRSPGSVAGLLLNVAFTRAKCRFYLIANTKRLLLDLRADSVLSKIVRHFYENAQKISSESLLDSYSKSELDKQLNDSIGVNQCSESNIRLYNAKTFCKPFFQDLHNSRKRIIIVSAFLTEGRSSTFIDDLSLIKRRGVDIQIYTKPRNEQSSKHMKNQTDIVIKQFCNMGINVRELADMHHKIAIIDDDILWEGSLNILSYKNTLEHMRRLKGHSTVEEMIKNAELHKARDIERL